MTTASGYAAAYNEAGQYWHSNSQTMFGYVYTCPGCALRGTPEFFGESCAGECSCPKCDESFQVEFDDEDEQR